MLEKLLQVAEQALPYHVKLYTAAHSTIRCSLSDLGSSINLKLRPNLQIFTKLSANHPLLPGSMKAWLLAFSSFWLHLSDLFWSLHSRHPRNQTSLTVFPLLWLVWSNTPLLFYCSSLLLCLNLACSITREKDQSKKMHGATLLNHNNFQNWGLERKKCLKKICLYWNSPALRLPSWETFGWKSRQKRQLLLGRF